MVIVAQISVVAKGRKAIAVRVSVRKIIWQIHPLVVADVGGILTLDPKTNCP
jgi:hypothetical protein